MWTATHSWAYKEAPSSTVLNAQVRDNMDYLKTAVENATPVGTVTMFGGAVAPTGYLLCQGQAISRSTYAALFAIIGVAYGIGDNSTTFNLPNLQDTFPIGKSGTKALGSTGGEATHTLSTAELAVHTHLQTAHHHRTGYNFPVGSTAFPSGSGGGAAGNINNGAAYSENTTAVNQNAGSGSAHNNLPTYQAINYIIKY